VLDCGVYRGVCGLRAAETYVNCIKAVTPLPLQDFVVDLRERLRAVWRELDGTDPRTHAQKLATYHAWMALPIKPSNVRGPPHVLPRYLELELSRHVLPNIARLRLAHTLRVEPVVGKATIGSVTNVTCMMSRTKSMPFFCALAWKCAI